MISHEDFLKLTLAEQNELPFTELVAYYLSRCFMEEADIKVFLETFSEGDRKNFAQTVRSEHAKVKARMTYVFERALTWLRHNRPQARAIPVVEVSISHLSEMKWI